MGSETISVISIIYDVDTFLEQSIESMVNQTYRDLEIILVIGEGKGDGCLDIAEKFAAKDDRIKIVSTPARGTGDARNQGLNAATGSYIGFVDGDDYAEPEMFEKMMKNLREHGADIAVCGKYSEYSDGSVADKREGLQEMTPAEAYEMIMRWTGFFFHCWDKLFKAEIFDGLRFPDDRYLEDRYVIDKAIGRASKIVYDPEALYHYRVRGDSLSRIRKMSEYNTDADTDFCEFVSGNCPELKNICRSFLMYDHITCIQNYLLYFRGEGSDSDMDERYRKHLKYVAEDSKIPNPEINGKMKLKIFLCLHMRSVLAAITRKNVGKAKAEHEVFTR